MFVRKIFKLRLFIKCLIIMKKKIIPSILYFLITLFLLLVSFFVIPFSDNLRHTLFPVAGVLAFIFCVLGFTLIFLARKEKGKQKLFLLITGISAAGFLVSVILHNFLYALAILAENIAILHYTFEFLHTAFFIVGIIGCPIGFLVGVIGFLVLHFHKKK